MSDFSDVAAERAIWLGLAQRVESGKATETLDTLRKRGLRKEWFSNSAIRAAIEGAMILHLQRKEVSLLAIMSHVNSGLARNEWGSLSKGWREALEMDPVPLEQYIPSLKQHHTMRIVGGILLNLEDARREEPKNVNTWLPHFIQRFQAALKDGRDYDPTPSSIWNQGEPTKVIGSTGLKTLDEAFRGGIRNGMMVTWVSPTKSGKSRMTYTLAAHAISQKYPVAIISTEARPFDVVAGVLQARGGYDDWEIEHKKGREEHRDLLMGEVVQDMDRFLYVWDSDAGTQEGIEEVLYWTQPSHLILDHMMPMVVQTGSQNKYAKRNQQIYDFSLFLEGAAVRHRCTITVFCQLSSDNEARLKKKHDLPNLPAFGSAGPGHAASIGILSMRHWEKPNTMFGRVKLDRIAGLMDTTFELRHDPETHTFYEVVE